MSVTPPRSSVETDEDALRMTKIVREDFVKQDFPVSDDRVGRFVFDTSLQTVKLYVLDSYEDYRSECAYLLLTAIDWTYFYNQIWREFNFGDKIRYIFQWDAVTQGMRYRGDNADGLHVHFILLEQNASRPKLSHDGK